jgi:hypothetical protein
MGSPAAVVQDLGQPDLDATTTNGATTTSTASPGQEKPRLVGTALIETPTID